MGLPFENADYNEDEVGARKIPELTDVVLTNVQNDNVLVYNNGVWENQAQSSSITEISDIPGVTITNVQDNQFLKYISGVWVNSTDTDANTDNLNDLTDTLLTTPFGDDEVLKYSGGKWKNGNIPIEKLSNVYISNLQDGETLRYVQANTRWENAYNIDTLDELSDVTISSNLNNHVLKYNNTDGVYKNAYLNVTDLGDTNITTLANGNTLIYNNGEWSAGNISYTETDPVFTQSPAGSILDGTGFLKNNGGTWSYDTNTYLTSYTETDPVFTISPAGSITNGNGFLKNNGSGTWSYETNVVVATASRVGTWDTAYGWGDHAAQTYLTSYTETDPVFTISPAGSITNGNGFLKNNGSGTWSYETNVVVATASRVGTWDTAYGWGDHAAQTYLTSYTETDPVFTISPAGSITNGNGFLKNNGSGTWSYETNVVVATASRVGTWDTAYGWGDHAAQTYIKNIAPLHIDTTNNRVGINVALPGVEFEVGNTFNINDTSRRVGILNTNPTTAFQVGYTLNTNLTTERVGIGIVSPAEKLDVDSVIQITGQTATRASLYFSKVIAPEVKQDLAEITSQSSGTNGGDIEFWTADSGTRTKKITINEKGAIGIGATPDYGTTGQFLRTGTATSPPIWKSLTLGGLDDVFINLAPGATQPVNGEFIAWRANTGRWENTSVLSGYTTSTNVFNITGQLAINGSIGSNGYVLFSGAGASSPNWSNNLNSFLFTNCNLIGTKPLLCDGQAGANGDILTSRGPANTPHWVTPSAGGSTFTNLTATGTIFANTIDRYANGGVQIFGNVNSSHITIEHNHPSHAYGSGTAGSWYGGYNGANLFAGHSSFRARNNQCQASHNLTITSDDRFKSRTVNLPDNCLDIINKLQPKKYLKHHGHYVPEGVEDSDLSGVDTKDEAGLISQDVEKIPELNWLITEQELGIDTKKYYKAIDYGSLYPYLIKAVQELNECVKTLEAKVKTLESK